MTRQLFCRDLSSGDILLKVNAGSATNVIIAAAQKAAGEANPEVVHAGILFDPAIIIEASGPGLSARDLRVQDKAFGYYVYRCSNASIAAGAGTCAKLFFDIQSRTGGLKYNLTGAAGSLFGGPGRPASAAEMDSVLDALLAAKEHPYFCSQFVVYVYQYVAEQCGVGASKVFNFSDAKMPPSVLASALVSHPLFAGVGYLMPNER